MQPHLERVAERYIVRFTGSTLDDDHRFDVFATEGGAAAMTYIFTTLRVNGIVGPGDAVAVATPTYTPYLQIPVLERIGFSVVEIKAASHQAYRFDELALDALRDPRIKVFFVINPGNPDSRAVTPERLADLTAIVERDRADLLIVNDTAYATFVESFHGVTAVIRATSSSALLLQGVRGDGQPARVRRGAPRLRGRPCAGRQVGRGQGAAAGAVPGGVRRRRGDAVHPAAAGRQPPGRVAQHRRLATPDQVQMTLFELAYLMPEGAHYVEGARASCRRGSMRSTPVSASPAPGGDDSHYYGMVDIMTVAAHPARDELVERITRTMEPEEVALRLASTRASSSRPGRASRASHGTSGCPWPRSRRTRRGRSRERSSSSSTGSRRRRLRIAEADPIDRREPLFGRRMAGFADSCLSIWPTLGGDGMRRVRRRPTGAARTG
jgi:aspartate 4-decarboxylase